MARSNEKEMIQPKASVRRGIRMSKDTALQASRRDAHSPHRKFGRRKGVLAGVLEHCVAMSYYAGMTARCKAGEWHGAQ